MPTLLERLIFFINFLNHFWFLNFFIKALIEFSESCFGIFIKPSNAQLDCFQLILKDTVPFSVVLGNSH